MRGTCCSTRTDSRVRRQRGRRSRSFPSCRALGCRLRTRRVALVLFALGAAACKRELINIPAGPAELVLHGVLNPSDTMQIVLIERTLTGGASTPITFPYDPEEPISSDWGVPESHVTTSITAPDGTV